MTSVREAIGVFDSGVGGLTVLKVLAKRFPDESFIYLGDTARLPYGSKTLETIQLYVEQNIEFLRNLGVKAVVIACHSACSAWIRKHPAHDMSIPIYEVITPTCTEALKISQTKRIALFATQATVNGKAYSRLLSELDNSSSLYSQACPLLVPLVEEGMEDDPITQLIIERYLTPILKNNIDTLILGCTHYPRLIEGFRKVCGNDIAFVDPGMTVAENMSLDMKAGHLKSKTRKKDEAERTIQILTTDLSDSFWEVAQRILHPITVSYPLLVNLRA